MTSKVIKEKINFNGKMVSIGKDKAADRETPIRCHAPDQESYFVSQHRGPFLKPPVVDRPFHQMVP